MLAIIFYLLYIPRGQDREFLKIKRKVKRKTTHFKVFHLVDTPITRNGNTNPTPFTDKINSHTIKE